MLAKRSWPRPRRSVRKLASRVLVRLRSRRMPGRIAKSVRLPKPPRRPRPLRIVELTRRIELAAKFRSDHPTPSPALPVRVFLLLWLLSWLGELLEDGGEFPGLLIDAAAGDSFAAAGLAGVAVDGPEGEAADPLLGDGEVAQGFGIVGGEDFLLDVVLADHGAKADGDGRIDGGRLLVSF